MAPVNMILAHLTVLAIIAGTKIPRNPIMFIYDPNMCYVYDEFHEFISIPIIYILRSGKVLMPP
jgi:hypothetical protein